MDLMTNHIAKIICDTDLPNSNGFGTVRLNKKEAEILAAKLVLGLYPQDNLVADFEQQLKTEKAKYSLAVECYRDVYNKLQRIETGKFDFIWHKTEDGDFPESDNEVLCYCEDEDLCRYYTLGTYHPLKVNEHVGLAVNPHWNFDMLLLANSKVIAWTEVPQYE